MNGWQRQIEQQANGRFRRRALVGLLVLTTFFFALPGSRPARAQEVEVLLPHKEAQVKFALLYSFTMMITWPETAFDDAKSPFVIGVLGDRPHVKYLDRLEEAKKAYRGHPIVIEKYKSAAELQDCHLLFIAGGVQHVHERTTLTYPTKRSMLVVAERPIDAVPPQTHIHLVIENQSVKFHLDLEAAKARQLQVDPRLLKLAKVVPVARHP